MVCVVCGGGVCVCLVVWCVCVFGFVWFVCVVAVFCPCFSCFFLKICERKLIKVFQSFKNFENF